MASVTLTMRLALTPRRPSTRYDELELGYKSTVVVRALPSLGVIIQDDFRQLSCEDCMRTDSSGSLANLRFEFFSPAFSFSLFYPFLPLCKIITGECALSTCFLVS